MSAVKKFVLFVLENYEPIASDASKLDSLLEKSVEIESENGDKVKYGPISAEEMAEFYYSLTPEERIDFEKHLESGGCWGIS